MRVSGVTFGIGGGENGVNKDESANNLSTKTITLGVTRGNKVGTTIQRTVFCFPLETLHHASATNSTQALHHDVENRPGQRQLPRQKQPKCHRRVYVSPYTYEQTTLFNFILFFFLAFEKLRKEREKNGPEMPAVQ